MAIELDREKLVAAAWDARERAYAPYSKYKVGAAALGEDGNIYTGANVENVSYGATVCGERAAIFNMVNAGCKKFVALAIASGGAGDGASCMLCRQVLLEFCQNLDVPIISDRLNGNRYEHTLREAVPLPFMAFEPNEDYK